MARAEAVVARDDCLPWPDAYGRVTRERRVLCNCRHPACQGTRFRTGRGGARGLGHARREWSECRWLAPFPMQSACTASD